MPVPPRRHSKTRTRTRRAHHALKPIGTVTCSNCQADILPHMACTACGFYKGRQVVNMARSKDRVVKRLQKKMQGKAHDHDHDHDHKEEESKEEKKSE